MRSAGVDLEEAHGRVSDDDLDADSGQLLGTTRTGRDGRAGPGWGL